MRRLGRVLVLACALLLGLAAGVAVLAVHRSFSGLLLGVGTTMITLWALRRWVPRAATAFAAGWLTALVLAVSGRGEGDYVVSSDTLGWLLIASGFVVLVTGLAWGGPPTVRHDSDSVGVPT